MAMLGAGLLAAIGCGTASVRPQYAAGTVTRDFDRLRNATRPFHVLDSAVAVGYPRTVPACLVHQHHGAMGFHHVNQQYLDGKVEIERPEILLYERGSDDSYALNGVEFILPYRFWPRDSVPPVLMQQPLRREDNLKFWYLHVWAWKENPDGLFADFHPGVSCPDSARRVFIPSGDSLR